MNEEAIESKTGELVRQCSPEMSGTQRRFLRSRAHHVKPLVLIGDRGLHDGVFVQIDKCLDDHELIKVKYRGASREALCEAAAAIFSKIDGQTVQIVGKILVVYRPDSKSPRLQLPNNAQLQG